MIFKREYNVTAGEIDSVYRIQPSKISSFFQDAAACHCIELEVTAFDLDKDGLSWILSSQEFFFEHYPIWHDKVIVETWMRKTETLRCYRDFLLRDQAGRVLAGATTAWVIIDKKTVRPKPLALLGERLAISKQCSDLALEQRTQSPLAIDESTRTPAWAQKKFTVGYEYVDFNQHANNVGYLEWALETVPLGFRQAWALRSASLSFQREVSEAEEITVRTDRFASPSDTVILEHEVHTGTGQRACLVQSQWQSRAGEDQSADFFLDRVRAK